MTTAGVSNTGNLSVEEIATVLTAGSGDTLSPAVGVSLLDHALQTGALLERAFPDDLELATAGLVHDLGHMLDGGSDETHAEDGAGAVRRTLGERVAGIVALHVAAKRYLVATEDAYGDVLSGDSVVSLGRQGGAMTDGEMGTFCELPWAVDAVTLRRADDMAKVEGLVVRDLTHWVPILEQVSTLAGGAVV